MPQLKLKFSSCDTRTALSNTSSRYVHPSIKHHLKHPLRQISKFTKKRVVDEDSSLIPLIKEVEAELDFVQLVNKPLPKPWVPLRELEEDQPYRIVAVREHTNQHGRRIILKIINAGSKCEVYLPQRFASCIDAGKIRHFNETCKNYVLVVTHKCPNWTDIKIVKA
ncbi:uncharacterized protein LOC120355576 [Nilaparvata lugens]|uniref:uncharacterized protein LOC120355576 n=1 Tax=Nilaparvata lugens TaxID=108931 RepID=UPI00193DDC3A|nr:uncharacterized protein LOC120355576 [Nilaparvata lugens]